MLLTRLDGVVSHIFFQLLYSEWSQSCLINEEYADPENFDQVFDIYSTNMLASTRYVHSFDLSSRV